MTDYPVGTVAIVTDTVMGKGFEWRAHKVDKGWQGLDSNWGFVLDSEILTVRPLILLDLHTANPDGNPEIVLENLLRTLRERGRTTGCMGIADQIEAQVKPPRIPEPGLWGVVEASTGDTYAWHWVHHPKDIWLNAEGDGARWDDLADPVLIRPGIEDAQ